MKYNISKTPFFLRNYQHTSTFQMKLDWQFNWLSEDKSNKEKRWTIWQCRSTNQLKVSVLKILQMLHEVMAPDSLEACPIFSSCNKIIT